MPSHNLPPVDVISLGQLLTESDMLSYKLLDHSTIEPQNKDFINSLLEQQGWAWSRGDGEERGIKGRSWRGVDGKEEGCQG